MATPHHNKDHGQENQLVVCRSQEHSFHKSHETDETKDQGRKGERDRNGQSKGVLGQVNQAKQAGLHPAGVFQNGG